MLTSAELHPPTSSEVIPQAGNGNDPGVIILEPPDVLYAQFKI